MRTISVCAFLRAFVLATQVFKRLLLRPID